MTDFRQVTDFQSPTGLVFFAGWLIGGSGDRWFAHSYSENVTHEGGSLNEVMSKIPAADIQSAREMAELERSGGMEVDGEKVKIVAQFPVLYAGWECDSKGWIARREDGSLALVMSSHTRPYFAEEKEALDKIEEYRDAIRRTQEALAILKK